MNLFFTFLPLLEVNGYTEGRKIYQSMTAVEDTSSRYAKAA